MVVATVRGLHHAFKFSNYYLIFDSTDNCVSFDDDIIHNKTI